MHAGDNAVSDRKTKTKTQLTVVPAGAWPMMTYFVEEDVTGPGLTYLR